MLSYERYKELKDLAIRDFNSDEEKHFFFLLEEAPLNIVVLDKEYIKKDLQPGYYKYQVALTSNMNTFLTNTNSIEDIDTESFVRYFVEMYYSYFNCEKEEILEHLIDVKEELNLNGRKIIEMFNDIYNFCKFVKNSNIDLEDLERYFNSL